VSDIDRFGIECEPPRSQAGNCGLARAVGNLYEEIFAFLSSHRSVLSLNWFGHGPEADQRVIGTAVAFAAHVSNGETKIDKVMTRKRKGCIV
jgi:hypothetical protein